ncbi:hypothetical protein, partial [Klebsiella pneumoniae]|uniref:hypothetical protein n=1 Tax=Klebsiella pneumoniae TaxID=573 RepID=UPI003013A6B0
MLGAGTSVIGIVEPADGAGNKYGVSLASGGSASATGIWRFTAFTTDANGVTVTDGTNSAPIAVPGTNIKTVTASTYVTYAV